MLREVTSIALALLVSISAVPIARAERLALAIGIDRYSNLPPAQQLQRAVSDSKAVGNALSALGYKVTVKENVGRSAFNEAWSEFISKIRPGDSVLLYFSGHGVELDGTNYLLPSDVPMIDPARQELLKRESLSLSEFLIDLRAKKAILNLVIVDACRDNPFALPGKKAAGGLRGLAALSDPPQGTFVIYSAGAGETALDRLPRNDNDPNSVFTRKLIPLMEQRCLAIHEMARTLRDQVRSLARTASHSQRPAYYDELDGTFYLAGCQVAPEREKPPQIKPEAPEEKATGEKGTPPTIAGSNPPTVIQTPPGEKPKSPPRRKACPDPTGYSYSIWGKGEIDSNTQRTAKTDCGVLVCIGGNTERGGPGTRPRNCYWRR